MFFGRFPWALGRLSLLGILAMIMCSIRSRIAPRAILKPFGYDQSSTVEALIQKPFRLGQGSIFVWFSVFVCRFPFLPASFRASLGIIFVAVFLWLCFVESSL